MDDPKQCSHLSQLPRPPLEDELVKLRKTGWKKRRRAKHPIAVDQPGAGLGNASAHGRDDAGVGPHPEAYQ